jgi:hypothetical protein
VDGVDDTDGIAPAPRPSSHRPTKLSPVKEQSSSVGEDGRESASVAGTLQQEGSAERAREHTDENEDYLVPLKRNSTGNSPIRENGNVTRQHSGKK